jgi:UDP-N-acetylmuramate--alanine ligase
MAGTIIRDQGWLAATILAGSAIASFGGRCTTSIAGGKRYFIAETCEYRRHFMNFSPSIIVLTSVESDHQDYYPTYADIRDAFIEYCLKLPRCGMLIYCADDPGASEVAAALTLARRDVRLVPYGETAPDDGFKVDMGAPKDGEQHFRVTIPPPRIPKPRIKPKRRVKKPHRFFEDHVNLTLYLPGKHLVLDAAAAVALTIELYYHEKHIVGYPELDAMIRSLKRFQGSKRRSEVLGEARETIFVDDYGHHPTAIRRTLEGYREFYPGRRIICDFMSHTYSRTSALLEDFATAFGAADAVLLHRIYPSAREPAVEGMDEQLVEAVRGHHPNVTYVPDHTGDEALKAAYRLVINKPDEEPTPALFITMGAGDNWKLGARLLDTFKNTYWINDEEFFK